eukprot:gene38878-48009_t
MSRRKGGRIAADGALHIAVNNPAGHWQAALAALRALLEQPGTGTTARDALAARLPLHVSLSGRWCQALMAPWSDALLSGASASRFLESQLATVYGDAARSWTASSDEAPYGQPRLVCGIATELLDALHALAAAHGTRCAAIEPLASVICTSLAAGKPQAFAVIEPGRITMAALENGRVHAIQSQPCSAAWHVELAQAWQRWALRAPELASIPDIAVVDLSGHPAGLAAGQLPGLLAGGRMSVTRIAFVRAAAPLNGWRLALLAAGSIKPILRAITISITSSAP